MTKKERDLEALLGPTVEALGCRIWGLEYSGLGKRAVLRIYIDNDTGVTIDDCERVSKQVSGLLDVEDAFKERYTLEVSTPGLDRVLFKPEQYAESIGEKVDVRLTFPLDGRRHFVGRLNSLEDGEIAVQVDEEEEVVIPLESVQRARVVPQFD